jgi:NAD(P)-dependent dehydrogenase (short-subunit alcohol dehydrogenase family)
MPTFLITGCSSGIGLELVKTLAARGDTVYATVRRRESSMTGVDAISAVAASSDNVHILEGVDVAIDGVGQVLATALAGVALDVIIHNAGSLNATREHGTDVQAAFGEQKLASISMDRMRAVFELNTLGPLRVMKAVLPNVVAPGGKVITISTGLGSIGDNGSGGNYAYRTSKAALNMVTKNFACDLKESGIAVAAVAPGTVATQFGPGIEAMQKFGAKPPAQACEGIIRTIDELTMEKTGQYIMVPTSGGAPTEFPW